MSDLANIRGRIEGPSEDERFTAWMEWYSSTDSRFLEEMNRLLELKDPVLKLLWVRFLSHIPEERAVTYLRELLKDENSIVVEAAKRGFDKNQFENKENFLLPIVLHHNRSPRDFAIERLYQTGNLELIDPLLSLIPAADEALLLLILTAFRHIPSVRLLPHLLPFLKDPREKIRERTVYALSSLYETGLKNLQKIFAAHLNDASPVVRIAILWSLRRKTYKKNLGVFLEVVRNDSDPTVRQEALLGLADFPNPKVIFDLIQILVTEKNKMVLLKAESVLIGMPPAEVVKGLQQVWRKSSKEVHMKAMVYLAYFQKESQDFFRQLVAGLKKAKEDKWKVAYLETLGILGNPKAVEVLKPFVKGPSFLAYTAVGALVRLSHHGQEWALVPYLKDPSIPDILKQTMLKDLVRRGKLIHFSDELVHCLTEFLKSDKINIRYLSAHALVLAGHESSLRPLLVMLLQEKDPTTLKFLEESILSSLTQNPQTYLLLLEEFQNQPSAVSLLLTLMRGVLLPREMVVALIDSLLFSDLRLQEGTHAALFGELLASWIRRNHVPLEWILDRALGDREKEAAIPFLIQYFVRAPTPDLIPSTGKLRGWFERGSPQVRSALLELVHFSKDPQAARLPVAILCHDALKLHHAKAREALQALVWGES